MEILKTYNELYESRYDDRFAKITIEQVWFYAIHHNDLKLAKEVIKKGIDINIIATIDIDIPYMNTYDNSALYITPYLGMTKLLIKNGADLDIRNTNHETALFGAIRSKIHKHIQLSDYIKKMKLLLDAGADPNIRDYLQRTPLLYIAEVCGQNYSDFCIEMMGLLINAGADWELKNRNGEIFFDILSEYNQKLIEQNHSDNMFIRHRRAKKFKL